MIHFVPIGSDIDGEQMYELRRDGEPGQGYLVGASPELVEAIQAALELASNIYAALHPELES